MHLTGRSGRERDPQVIAALATAATIALAGAIAWLAQAPITEFLIMLSVNFLAPHRLISAWGALMTMVAIVISVIDGTIALVADIKGRGNTAPMPPPKHSGLRGALMHDLFTYWFALYSWCGALGLIGIGLLLRLRIL